MTSQNPPNSENLCIESILDMKNRLLEDGNLFEDDFPFLSDSTNLKEEKLVWKRPQEISPSPKMTSGYENANFICGSKGNSCFLSALAALSQNPSLMNAILPDGQNFETDYCGLFYYRFWKEGKWVYIVIDDRILIRSDTQAAVYTSLSQKEEFWVQLLEKAFAKYCGCYDNMLQAKGVLVALTGGLTEIIPVSLKEPDNFLDLKKLCNSGAVMQAAFSPELFDPENDISLSESLSEQKFAILGVILVDLSDVKGFQCLYRLVKLKYCFGKPPWTSSWEKATTDWLNLPENVRRDYKLKVEDDSEFYLSYGDFKRSITEIWACTVPNCKFAWAELDCAGYASTFTFKQDKLGFDINKFDTIKLQYFPQFKMIVEDVFGENKVDFLISLFTVDNQSAFRQFFVYRMNEEEKLPLEQTFFSFNQPVYKSRLSRDTEVVARVPLQPGAHALIVVYEKTEPTRFVLRLVAPRSGVAVSTQTDK